MATVNWNAFEILPGAADSNFEKLCRALVRRHYGRFGRLFARANQPGVEFHLKLDTDCPPLGPSGSWFGWQCKWYGVPSGRAIGTKRRNDIADALHKTESEVPGITDWVLWTRHHLTKGDQDWFYALSSSSCMRLHLWTAAEVEELLSGPGEIFRSTYFGELVLTDDALRERHVASAARVKQRWHPEVHQVVEAERILRRSLGETRAWSDLSTLAIQLEKGSTAADETSELPSDLDTALRDLTEEARVAAHSLNSISLALDSADFDLLRQGAADRAAPSSSAGMLARRLRSRRQPASLVVTNLVADLHRAFVALNDLSDALASQLIAVVADAGCGKTELAAQITAPDGDRPAGVLLYGSDLHASHSLDDLAKGFVVQGKPVPTFEALIAAVDAAGQRSGHRLPVVIDGLNEAEDPRDWKGQLASLSTILPAYPHVLVVCTLRPGFEEAVPKDLFTLDIPDFEEDAEEAIARYFQHYRIDPSDAGLLPEVLRHPLTLQMFCEVTNPQREYTVSIEAMPESLPELFERYLDLVCERISELSPRAGRYFPADVRTALNVVGLALWESNARSIDITQLKFRLGDDGKPWDKTMVRALESDGVLFRVPEGTAGAGRMAVLYDWLAGHLIADALLDVHSDPEFTSWLHEANTSAALWGQLGSRHSLGSDIFRSLVALSPRRRHRRQWWPLLDEPWRTEALYFSAWLEGRYLDRETVDALSELVKQDSRRPRDLFDRLRSIRGAQSHPLNAQFLDRVLGSMTIADRDLRWSEWMRREWRTILDDVLTLEKRWQEGRAVKPSDRLRARWIMWTLTTTVRLLRDHATRALYWFGQRDPAGLAELTLDSLSISDPYVPERMLAACYGVAMALWSAHEAENLRSVLPKLANDLVTQMFAPGAPHPTHHVLARDYALGVIALALRVAPGCIPAEQQGYLRPPFEHIRSPFPSAAHIDDSVAERTQSAIRMDFGNYTIGGLIPDRGNYDYDHPTYRAVRRQIEHRIVELGYSSARFAEIDRLLGEDAWRAESRHLPKIDRYGKKYSWIAYFEMYGVRSDEDGIPDWRAEERTPDADIDPSFPEEARVWRPALPDIFASPLDDFRKWLEEGPTPDYGHLLEPREIDDVHGPWLLLDGYIEQSAREDDRRVFTFLRGVFVKRGDVHALIEHFQSLKYPGNHAIPDAFSDYYTFAGEIPWSERFGSGLRARNGAAKRDLRPAFERHHEGRWMPGVAVEIPSYHFAWESYHSSLNQVSGIQVPAPALCERLGLRNRRGEWDFDDDDGKRASLYRVFKSQQDTFRSRLLFLRADLLRQYLARTRQSLVWFVWGERGFDYRAAAEHQGDIQDVWQRYGHIHRHHVILTTRR